MNRISLRDGTFSGQRDAIEIVIINAGPVSREYFANDFDASQTVLATCWSVDTQRPDPDVQVRQSSRCLDCKQNIRGSSGYGRACRFLQRIAVVSTDNLKEVQQIQLPATSIFGKTKGGHMPLQEYVRHLAKNNTKATSVVTKIYFDNNSAVPKLFFKPVCGLNKEQLETVRDMANHPDAIEAITFAVKQSATPSPFDIGEGYAHN